MFKYILYIVNLVSMPLPMSCPDFIENDVHSVYGMVWLHRFYLPNIDEGLSKGAVLFMPFSNLQYTLGF